MSVETLRKDIDHEPIPVLSYEEYRGLCDGMQPNVYRKTGIDSEEGYRTATRDERTVYVELNGKYLPLFVPLEHAGGYNTERTKELAGVENAYALALPPGFTEGMDIDLETHAKSLGENTAILIETAAEDTDAIRNAYLERLGEAGWRAHDFLDTRLEGVTEEEQRARISIYAAHFEARDGDGNLLPSRSWSLEELYEEEVEEFGATDTELIASARITEDDELFERLWDLHDEKFDWLGEFHPVSMQENKEFFRQLVTDERTKSIVRFDVDENGDRVPACHGILLEGMDQVEWINDRFKETMQEQAAENDEQIVFYYGIASKSSAGKTAHYAKDVMGLNTRLAQRKGGKVELVLESTTMSSLYIPRLVSEYARAEPRGMTATEDPKPVSRLDYWALVCDQAK